MYEKIDQGKHIKKLNAEAEQKDKNTAKSTKKKE
jgi:hypothetical protein